MAAAIFEAPLSTEQAASLARLMDEGRPTRPTDVPRGRELMPRVGADPTMTIVDVLEHA